MCLNIFCETDLEANPETDGHVLSLKRRDSTSSNKSSASGIRI